MAVSLLVLIISVFLAGAAFGTFLMILFSIHAAERRMSLRTGSTGRADLATRQFLGVYVRDEVRR
jgi:hypothetical protein